MSLISIITLPLMLYIGAEGYSERDAKVTMLESKNRSEISDKVIEKLVTDLKELKE